MNSLAIKNLPMSRKSPIQHLSNAKRMFSTENAPEMKYRGLGSSGLKVSVLSFGSWVTFGKDTEDKCYDCMKVAYDGGMNVFDNAEAYAQGESELVMGRILKKAGWRRENLVLSSKIFWGGSGPNDRGLSRKHLIEGTHNSLKRMQVDYLDLLFCHRPDPHTPIIETIRAMNYLVEKGLVLYWGTSEWSATQLTEAYLLAEKYSLIPPSMEQPEYSMLERQKVEKEFKPLYLYHGLGTTTFSPLKYGILSGKYLEGEIPKDSRGATDQRIQKILSTPEGKTYLKKVEKLKTVAESLGGTVAQLALAWCMRNPFVSTVITGASRPEQVTENLGALKLVAKLDDYVINQIDAILGNKPTPDPDARRR